jgi:large subunit ribosomal protein L23
MNPYEVLRRPILTEKTGQQSDELHRYTFRVDVRANKLQIKEAVEHAFNVKVLAVNVVNVRGKARRWGRIPGRTEAWKKAVVTLLPGQTIQFFEGV